MKNKFMAGFALLILVITISSCATSKKYGCPGNPMASVSKVNR